MDKDKNKDEEVDKDMNKDEEVDNDDDDEEVQKLHEKEMIKGGILGAALA